MSQKILKDLGIEETRKTKVLTEEEVVKIRAYIDNNFKVESSMFLPYPICWAWGRRNRFPRP